MANIDQLVVIGSAAIPKTDPFLIDRIAATAALKGCEVVVLLNKCDLDPAEELYRIYTAAGFPTLRISAETGEGLEELIPLVAGKLSAFTGNSGVGKSSILKRWTGVPAKDRGDQHGPGPGTPHHPPCGAVPSELRGGDHGFTGIFLF